MRIRARLCCGLLLIVLAGPARADHDRSSASGKVAVDRDFHLATIQKLLRDLGDLEASEPPPAARDRLAAMRQALQALRADLERAPVAQVAPGAGPPPSPPGPSALSATQFDELLAELGKLTYAEQKVRFVCARSRGGWFTVEQVIQVMNALALSRDKSDAAVCLYAHTVDRASWSRVYSALPYTADREALKKRIGH